MNKLSLVGLFLVVITFVVVASIYVAPITSNIDLGREDMQRLVNYDQLNSATNIFMWGYRAFDMIIQALVILAAGVGIIMLVRKKEVITG